MKQIAIIVSRFNSVITQKLSQSAKQRLLSLGIAEDAINLIEVPGAIEIPLTARLLAKTYRFAAIIALGAVIRGETSHYDYVCEQVSHGCQRVMLDFELPIIFGVLTTDNEEQALARTGGSAGDKGVEAADAAIQMINLIESISS